MPLFSFDELLNSAAQAPETSGPRKNFEPLEKGDYEFVIKEVPKVNNEKQYLNIRAVVASGERANYNVFHITSFKQGIAPFAAKQTVDLLTACGITQDQLRQAGSLEDVANALVGRTFTAYVDKEPDQYKNERKDPSDNTTYYRNRLTQFRPSTGTVNSGPGVPQQNNAPAPQQFQGNQQQPPAQPNPAQFAQGQEQPNPWGQPSPPPAQGNGPQTQFQAPPMPFGNNNG